VTGDLTLPATATLGYYTIRLRNGPPSDDADADAGNGQFRVEDYRKPEYQVRVSPAKPRLLQGETMPVVIDARYFLRRTRRQCPGKVPRLPFAALLVG
jgi:uncharacterized protein YfaS (alpha-2-macroglobulin family)